MRRARKEHARHRHAIDLRALDGGATVTIAPSTHSFGTLDVGTVLSETFTAEDPINPMLPSAC
jgi:hypothetical protein